MGHDDLVLRTRAQARRRLPSSVLVLVWYSDNQRGCRFDFCFEHRAQFGARATRQRQRDRPGYARV